MCDVRGPDHERKSALDVPTCPHAPHRVLLVCGCQLLCPSANISVDLLVLPLQDGLGFARQDCLVLTRQDGLFSIHQNGLILTRQDDMIFDPSKRSFFTRQDGMVLTIENDYVFPVKRF